MTARPYAGDITGEVELGKKTVDLLAEAMKTAFKDTEERLGKKIDSVQKDVKELKNEVSQLQKDVNKIRQPE